MAQGRSTTIVSMIQWIRTSIFSKKISLSADAAWRQTGRRCPTFWPLPGGRAQGQVSPLTPHILPSISKPRSSTLATRFTPHNPHTSHTPHRNPSPLTAHPSTTQPSTHVQGRGRGQGQGGAAIAGAQRGWGQGGQGGRGARIHQEGGARHLSGRASMPTAVFLNPKP